MTSDAQIRAPIEYPGDSTSPLSLVPPWVCKLLLLGIFAYFAIYHIHHERKDHGGHLGDFHTFYQAGQFVVLHRDIYTAGPNSSQMYVYPPLIAVLCAPLSHLSILSAAHVWLIINVFALLVSVLLGTRAMLWRLGIQNAAAPWIAALLVALLSENELRAVLTMLETDPIMLLMFTLALWYLDEKPVVSGLALAFAFNIKYLPIVALPLLIIRRRWTAAIAMILGSIFFALAPSMVLGWHEDLRCLRVSIGGLLRWVGISPEASGSIKVHDIGDSLSVSVTSMLGRVLRPHGVTNSQVMVVAAGVGALCLAVVQSMYRFRKLPMWRWPAARMQDRSPFKSLLAMEWAGLITIALAFSPDTNTRHLVLAVLVNALGAAVVLKSGMGNYRLVAWAGMLVILLGFIMPFGIKGSAIHQFYFYYSIPGWSLLIGYLMILWSALAAIAPSGQSKSD